MPGSAPSLLDGRRVVVTRAPEQADELLRQLRAEGAETFALPTIAIVPPLDAAPLAAALARLADFDGCVFTSVNAVHAVFAQPGESAPPPPLWICAVGPATAAALARHAGWAPSLRPASAQAAGVAAALAALPLAGRRVFYPRAEGANDLIEPVLRARGADVVSPVAYRTVLAESSRALARDLFPGADAVLFTSPSTARNLATLLGSDHARRIQSVAIAVIGPVTEAAVQQLGWPVRAVAEQPDTASMLAALRSCFRA